jgi:hypothetical protein
MATERITPAAGVDNAVHEATVPLSAFAYEALAEEAERQGVTLPELLAHAALYYLADLDSGRVARTIPRTFRRGEDKPAG